MRAKTTQILFLLTLTSLTCYSQDIRTIAGQVTQQHAPRNPNDTLNEEYWRTCKDNLSFYKSKRDIITEYLVKSTNLKDEKGAKKILKQDKALRNYNVDPLLLFEFGKMSELNILFKHIIFVIEEDSKNKVMITCSKEQYEKLDKVIFKDNGTPNKLRFECSYIGDYILENMKVFELVNFELN